MPLQSGNSRSTISNNIREMTAAGHPQAQAVAASLSNATRHPRGFGGAMTPQGFAAGGMPSGLSPSLASPWWERSEARSGTSGFLHSTIPGRTDQINAGVRPNSYILPADVVSGLGEGNSLAGGKLLDMMFHTGPHGMVMPKGRSGYGGPHAPHMPMPEARGGKTDHVPVILAGGEYEVSPDAVSTLGGGDFNRGHAILDAFVKHVRKTTIKTMSKLPGPAKR